MTPEGQAKTSLLPPGGSIRPVAQGVSGPRGGLVHMTGRARIRNLVFVRHGRGDKGERVSAHEDAGNLRFDLRHVARRTFASRRAVLVMRVLRKRCLARPVA